MKHTVLSLLVTGLAIAGIASAKPLSATLTDTGGKPIAGFIVSADATGVKISPSPTGGSSRVVAHTDISEIQFNETPEGWPEALQFYNDGDFVEAERHFSVLADELKNIGMIKDQYGAMARYYQIMSLKENGKLSALATALSGLRTAGISLSDFYIGKLKSLKPWAAAGKEDWDGVLTAVAEYEDPKPNRPRTPFRSDLSGSLIAEMSYLRGLAKAKKGDKEGGLEDLYRALTLNNGSDSSLTDKAINAALKELENPADDLAKREAFALATYYKDAIGGGTIDNAYKQLLTPPPAIEKPEEEKEAPAEAEPK